MDNLRGNSSSRQQPTWFTRHGDLALYFAGLLMVLGGIAVESQVAVKTALILIGAAIILVGGLLARITGTIKISPQGIEIPVAAVIEWLEATRQEAQRRVPDRVEEAIGQAFLDLIPFLSSAGVFEKIQRQIETSSNEQVTGSEEDAQSTAAAYGSVTIAEPGEKSRFCRSCGERQAADAVFCSRCGADLSGERYRAKVESPASAPPAQNGPVGSICSVCGASNEPSNFCRRCGSQLHVDTEVPEVVNESSHEFAKRVVDQLIDRSGK